MIHCKIIRWNPIDKIHVLSNWIFCAKKKNIWQLSVKRRDINVIPNCGGNFSRRLIHQTDPNKNYLRRSNSVTDSIGRKTIGIAPEGNICILYQWRSPNSVSVGWSMTRQQIINRQTKLSIHMYSGIQTVGFLLRF